MTIDPIEWLDVANKRAPKKRGHTEWFPGTIAPARYGWYERYFTDSGILPVSISMHWWNGEFWASRIGGAPHWRQVGSYPSWRGVTFMAYMRGERKFAK